MASVFPDQIACAENLTGPREIPDHPLVRQAVHDCLHEAMDIDGLVRLLRGIESGAIDVVTRELTLPSPLSLEILTAKPYAYLDDAPLEERRTQAVMARRWMDESTAADLGRLDVSAIDRVRSEAWPQATSADELHDALLSLGFVTDGEVQANERWTEFVGALGAARRATRVTLPDRGLWVAAERLPLFDVVYPTASRQPAIDAPAEFARREWTYEDALCEIVRSRLEALGPVTIARWRRVLPSPRPTCKPHCFASPAKAWSCRDVLAGRRRRMVRPDAARAHPSADGSSPARGDRAGRDPRFHALPVPLAARIPGERREGPDALDAVIAQLQGFEAPAAAWESEILPARLDNYDFTWLDDLCLSGRVMWTRLTVQPSQSSSGSAGPIRTTPVTLLPRKAAPLWTKAAQQTALPAPVAADVPTTSRSSSARTARRSSTRSSTARGCCARRSRMRSPSSLRWGSRARTASPACARC